MKKRIIVKSIAGLMIAATVISSAGVTAFAYGLRNNPELKHAKNLRNIPNAVSEETSGETPDICPVVPADETPDATPADPTGDVPDVTPEVPTGDIPEVTPAGDEATDPAAAVDPSADAAADEAALGEDHPSGYVAWVSYREGGTCKGGDIWGTDWPIPVAEELTWYLYEDRDTGEQYLTTKLTDYILWFIPFSYYEYVYKLPAGTYGHGQLDAKQVVETIDFLNHWNWHRDEVDYAEGYTSVNFIKSDGSWDIYDIGNNDYSFIIHK